MQLLETRYRQVVFIDRFHMLHNKEKLYMYKWVFLGAWPLYTGELYKRVNCIVFRNTVVPLLVTILNRCHPLQWGHKFFSATTVNIFPPQSPNAASNVA